MHIKSVPGVMQLESKPAAAIAAATAAAASSSPSFSGAGSSGCENYAMVGDREMRSDVEWKCHPHTENSVTESTQKRATECTSCELT